MKILFLDTETYSKCDLKTQGTYKYARHPSTGLLCICWLLAECDADGKLNEIERGSYHPIEDCTDQHYALCEVLDEADFVAAHNAEFDQQIMRHVGEELELPRIEWPKWYCTSAQMRVNALPASLDVATRATGVEHTKDPNGNALIKALSYPQEDGTFNRDPELLSRMYEYCMRDVEAMFDLCQATVMLTGSEHGEWLANCAVNRRGMKVDVELAKLAVSYASKETEELSFKLELRTAVRITKHTQTARTVAWILEQLPQTNVIREAMRKEVDGVEKYSIDKASRAKVLALCVDEMAERYDYTPREINTFINIQAVVALIDEGNMSSVSKFKAMLNLADDSDDRVRGAFVYAGASQTLRFSSKGLQLHNLPSKCFKANEVQFMKTIMRTGGTLVGLDGKPMSVMVALKKLLRPALIPALGHKFVVGDWKAIEARVLPWLSIDPENPDPDAEKYLDIFRKYDREGGEDIYEATARKVGGLDRDGGKILTLALGFGGSRGALQAMGGSSLGLDADGEYELVAQWRKARPWAARFWLALKRAAYNAVKNPEVPYQAGRVTYTCHGDTLVASMPGNLHIKYPKVKIEWEPSRGGGEHALTAMKGSLRPKAGESEWPRVRLWHGLLAENVTQALAGKLLRELLGWNFDSAFFVGHTHDEAVLEVPTAYAEDVRDAMADVMCTPPDWAEDLPMAAVPTIMDVYGK